jgi:hypothetical protein
VLVSGDVEVGSDSGQGELTLGGADFTVEGDLNVQPATNDTVGAGLLRFAPTGTTAGADYGQIVHSPAGTSSAAMGGTLVMDFTDYAPSAGDSFELVTGFANVTGVFDSVSLVGVSAAAFDYDLSYAGGKVTFTANTGAAAGRCTTTVMNVKSLGVCRTVQHVGGVGVAFKQTDGGSLRYTYEREAKDGLSLPPIAGAFHPAGATKAQYWKASYDGAYSGGVELTFAYDQKLLDGNEDERLLAVWHHDGREWTELVPLVHNVDADYLTVLAGSFSPFVLGRLSRLPGDCDEDGDVDYLDYVTIKQKAGLTDRARWADGDFDGDRDVDRLDAYALRHYFGLSMPADRGGRTVPEPATLALLLAPAALLLARRRRE